MPRSYKLMIIVSLLVTFLCALPALASGNKIREICRDGEERDEQEEPKCCKPSLMARDKNGKKCADQPPDTSVDAGMVLVLSFTFWVAVQCFMNQRKVNIREYAYTAVSQAVSIFSALLTFQSINALIWNLIVQPLQTTFRSGSVNLVVEFLHMLFWYSMTQHTVAFSSCALKPDTWRKREMEAAAHQGHTNLMLQIEMNTICFGSYLAHLTGFAAISFWATLQQIEPFRQFSMTTLALVPVASVAQLLFRHYLCKCRKSMISRGGNDWFGRTWRKACQKVEVDVLSLTMSVLIVNSLRYAINEIHGHKCLPNAEQKETGPECEFQHSVSGACRLFGFGLFFVIALITTKVTFLKLAPTHKLKEQREPQGASRRWLNLVSGGPDNDEEYAKTHLDQILERLEEVLSTTLRMAHSWCIFHSAHDLLMALNPSFLARREHAIALAVTSACGVTYMAFVGVQIVNMLGGLQREWILEDLNHAIKTVGGAASIFIGFAWEQTFAESIDALSQRAESQWGPHSPAITKLAMVSACIGIICFAWRQFILPVVCKKAWRYGNVFSRYDLERICHELAEHDQDFHLGHLHHITESLSKKDSDHEIRSSVNHSLPQDSFYKSLPSSEADALRAEHVELKERIKYLEQQISLQDIDHKLSENTETNFEATHGEHQGLRAENVELRERIKYLEQQMALQDIDHKLSENTETEIEATHGEHQGLRTENVELKERIKYLEEQMALQDIDHKLSENTETNFEATHGEHQRLRAENVELKERIKYLEEQMALQDIDHKLNENTEKQVEATHREHQGLRAENVELKERIKYLEQQMALQDIDHKLSENSKKRLEAIHEENQGLKIHSRYLEEQLADERKAGEEWEIHRRFLEQQLAEERNSRSDVNLHCQACGQPYGQAFSQEANESDHVQELSERHLEDESRSRVGCSRMVDDEDAGNQSVRSDSRSPATKSSGSVTRSSESVERQLAHETSTLKQSSAFRTPRLERHEAEAAQRQTLRRGYVGEEVVAGCPQTPEPLHCTPPPKLSLDFSSVLSGAGSPRCFLRPLPPSAPHSSRDAAPVSISLGSVSPLSSARLSKMSSEDVKKSTETMKSGAARIPQQLYSSNSTGSLKTRVANERSTFGAFKKNPETGKGAVVRTSQLLSSSRSAESLKASRPHLKGSETSMAVEKNSSGYFKKSPEKLKHGAVQILPVFRSKSAEPLQSILARQRDSHGDLKKSSETIKGGVIRISHSKSADSLKTSVAGENVSQGDSKKSPETMRGAVARISHEMLSPRKAAESQKSSAAQLREEFRSGRYLLSFAHLAGKNTIDGPLTVDSRSSCSTGRTEIADSSSAEVFRRFS